MSHIENSFKKRFPLDKRMEESRRIIAKYPDRVPVIVENSRKCDHDFPTLDKQKYLVPGDLSAAQFSFVIRKRLKLKPQKAMFLLFDNEMITTSSLMKDIYDRKKYVDNFLYVICSGENTFGS